VNMRYIGGIEQCEGKDCNTPREEYVGPGPDGIEGTDDDIYQPRDTWKRDIDSNVNMDLFVSYQLESPAGITKLTVGCNNLLDANPPLILDAPTPSSDPEYDFLGRYFYVRLTQSF